MNKSSLFAVILSLFIIIHMFNNTYAQQSNNQSFTQQRANKWLKEKAWADGLKLKIHKSANVVEFATQYARNKSGWDKAFAFLKNTDLDTIKPGRYVLDGENVFVSVTESPTKAFIASRFEAHRKYIDLQYVIKGKEKMGVAPIKNSKLTEDFDSGKDIGFYITEPQVTRYYVAKPGTFFLFFPSDAHCPGIRVNGFESDTKLVVKIRVS
jgi:biofilm protein TabA